MQRKEASNQKMQEKKPVLELKNTKKKVWANMWNELFWFYPPIRCTLVHRMQKVIQLNSKSECEKSILEGSYLWSHVLIHTGVKPFQLPDPNQEHALQHR